MLLLSIVGHNLCGGSFCVNIVLNGSGSVVVSFNCHVQKSLLKSVE